MSSDKHDVFYSKTTELSKNKRRTFVVLFFFSFRVTVVETLVPTKLKSLISSLPESASPTTA